MIQDINTLTVLDLKEMLTKIKALDGEDPIPELIEISEGFETALAKYGFEEPQEPDKLHALVGLAWEMERRLRKIELALGNIIQRPISPLPGRDLSRMELIHRVPNRVPSEIIE